MRCPYCNGETDVLETRVSNDAQPEKRGTIVRRKRKCKKCERKFYTSEHPLIDTVTVIKSNGRSEPFDWNKLRMGIAISLRKIISDGGRIDQITSEIVADLMCRDDRNEIHSYEIGETVLRKLLEIDDVAYVRFASVYEKFSTLEDFEMKLARTKQLKAARKG